MAVPQNREQYDCITKGDKREPQHATPFWTGIRVRPEGGMFDPLTNENVKVYKKPDPNRHRNLSPYQSILVGQSCNRSENCIYFHNAFFVESICSYLHEGSKPIQCACVQGNLFWRLKDLFDFTCMIVEKSFKRRKSEVQFIQKIGQKRFGVYAIVG